MTTLFDGDDEDSEMEDDPLSLNDDVDPDLARSIGEGGGIEPFTDNE